MDYKGTAQFSVLYQHATWYIVIGILCFALHHMFLLNKHFIYIKHFIYFPQSVEKGMSTVRSKIVFQSHGIVISYDNALMNNGISVGFKVIVPVRITS